MKRIIILSITILFTCKCSNYSGKYSKSSNKDTLSKTLAIIKDKSIEVKESKIVIEKNCTRFDTLNIVKLQGSIFNKNFYKLLKINELR